MAFPEQVLSPTCPFLQMGCPGPLGEKVSDIQRSSAPRRPPPCSRRRCPWPRGLGPRALLGPGCGPGLTISPAVIPAGAAWAPIRLLLTRVPRWGGGVSRGWAWHRVRSGTAGTEPGTRGWRVECRGWPPSHTPGQTPWPAAPNSHGGTTGGPQDPRLEGRNSDEPWPLLQNATALCLAGPPRRGAAPRAAGPAQARLKPTHPGVVDKAR